MSRYEEEHYDSRDVPSWRVWLPYGIAVVVVLAIIIGAVGFATSFRTVGRQEVLLVYGGKTWMEPKVNQFKKLVGPGGRHNTGLANNEYPYPVTQRDWNMVGGGDEGGAVPVPTKGAEGQPTGTVADVEGRSPFRLNTKEADLKAFHERYGLKFEAWKGIDGASTDDGWYRTLKSLYEPNLAAAMVDAGNSFTYGELQTSGGRDRYNAAVSARLFKLLNLNLGGDYFCGILPASITPEQALKETCTPPGFVMAPLKIDQGVRKAAQEIEQINRQAEAKKAEAASIAKAIAASGLTPELWIQYQAIQSGKDVTIIVAPSGQPVSVTPRPAAPKNP